MRIYKCKYLAKSIMKLKNQQIYHCSNHKPWWRYRSLFLSYRWRDCLNCLSPFGCVCSVFHTVKTEPYLICIGVLCGQSGNCGTTRCPVILEFLNIYLVCLFNLHKTLFSCPGHERWVGENRVRTAYQQQKGQQNWTALPCLTLCYAL